MLWPIRGSARGKAGRQHVAGMVRSEASQAIPRRDRARQLRRPRGLPVLRMRQDSQKRQEARRGAEILLPRMRGLVQPADRDAVRLQEDPTVGMGGVPAPPLRVPSRQNARPGQQKRRKLRKILAYEEVFSALDGCQDGVVLAGRVWLDETFVKVDAATGSRRALGTTKNRWTT